MVKVNAKGYRVEVQYGSVYLFRNDTYDLSNRVCLYLHRERNQNNEMRLKFSADICSIPAGNSYTSISESRIVIKHWNRLLNLCGYLNDLNIVGNSLEMMDMVETIKRRERR